MAPKRFLLNASLGCAFGGLAVIALGIAAGPSDGELVGLALVMGGFMAFAAGMYGFVTWTSLSATVEGDALLTQADAYAAAGKSAWALTMYEEALRAGADPEYVEPRLHAMRARAERGGVHRERA